MSMPQSLPGLSPSMPWPAATYAVKTSSVTKVKKTFMPVVSQALGCKPMDSSARERTHESSLA